MQRGQFQMKKLEDGHCSIPRDSGPELINTNTNTNKDTNKKYKYKYSEAVPDDVTGMWTVGIEAED